VIKYDKVPNFGFASGGADPEEKVLPRWYAMVSDEATGDSMWRFTDTPPGARSGVREKITMLDVTYADNTGEAMAVSSWQVPPTVTSRGEAVSVRTSSTRPSTANSTNSRTRSLSSPISTAGEGHRHLRSVHDERSGILCAQENPRCGFIGGNQPAPNIQSNDVEVDYRGLVLAPDRVGCGLWILEFNK